MNADHELTLCDAPSFLMKSARFQMAEIRLFAAASTFDNNPQESPDRLLYLARYRTNEGLDAFVKLVQLDKSIVFDPGIAKMLHHLGEKRDLKEFALYAKAIAKPLEETKSQQLKYTFSGFISQVFKVAGHKITAPEIRRLFDLAAKIKSSSPNTIDVDFVENPESFSKGVQRKRKLWKRISNRTKT